ncbi:MAG: phage regulatory protein/antirepressor Ant [Prevotella sp.]|nr:phage regulatory protein/antirepressor Ant [Prevotella sp.]
METVITKLFNENGEQIITSLDIAKLTGKEHRNVLRDIRNMEPAWEKLHQLKFEQMQIRENLPNNGYRLRKVYALTKLECLYIATKYDDVSRAKLVLRWEELEKEDGRRKMEDVSASPKLLTTEREILKKGDEIRREQIEKENAPADGCLTISEVAELLKTSVKNLNQFLVKQDIQYRKDGRYYLTPQYEESGFAKERSFHYFSLEGEKKERLYLVWTPEGMEFIRHLYYLNN